MGLITHVTRVLGNETHRVPPPNRVRTTDTYRLLAVNDIMESIQFRKYKNFHLA